MNRPYIIAIDAVAGGGKTTLSKAVNEALYPSARYCFDEFDEPDIHPVDFYDWWLRGADTANIFSEMTPSELTTAQGKRAEGIVRFVRRFLLPGLTADEAK
jgi:hypothetical protein